MSTLAHLSQVPNLGPHTVLTKLVESAQEMAQGSQKTLPTVTLMLKSGLIVRGQCVAFSDEVGPRAIVMITQSGQDAAQDLSYVLISEVVGVSVHNALGMIETLSDGRLTKPTTNIPSLAELTRMASGVMDELNATTEAQMTIEIQDPGPQASPPLLYAYYHALRDLYSVMKKFASEEIARQSMQEQNFKFSIRVGDSAQVVTHTNQCLITLPADGSERISRESLRVNLQEIM